MEYNNNGNQLITIKNNFFLKTFPNKKVSTETKKINLKIKNKKSNSRHKNTKSHSDLHTNKNTKKKIKLYDSFKNNYMEAPNKIQKSESQRKKLETIDLIEKNTKNIYDWNILLHNPNLGLYYKKNEYKKLELNKEKKEQNNNLPKFPVVLLDLSENQVKKYFAPKKTFIGRNNKLSSSLNKNNSNNSPYSSFNSIKENKNKNKLSQKRAMTETINEIKNKDIISHNIRPMSIYSIRKPEETFYYSNDFNDYYKEDLKTFSEKMTILKPRIKASNKRLKKEILKQRIKSSKEEKKLNEVIKNVKNQSIKFKKLDLIIAGERKNVEPLLKNIHYQENPHLKRTNDHIKLYYKTMKPYGNNNENIDYTKNERWRPSNEIKYLREKHKQLKKYNNVGTSMDNSNIINKNDDNIYYNNNSKLILSYYDKDDPDIKYFNYLINRNNNKESNYNNEMNNYNYINDDDKIKEKIYLSTIQNYNKDSNNIKKELTKKEFSKFPFIIEQYKQYKKSNKDNNQEKEQLNVKTYTNPNYFITETTKNTFNSLYST